MQPPPHSASRVFAPVVGRKTPPAQVATGDDHHVCKWSIGVPDAAINATCVRACRGIMVSPHASCIDCCIRHSNGTCAGPNLVGGMVVVVA